MGWEGVAPEAKSSAGWEGEAPRLSPEETFNAQFPNTVAEPVAKSTVDQFTEFETGFKRGLAKLAGGVGQLMGVYSQEDIDAALRAMVEERAGEGLAGKVGEFAGETAPTLLIPGGGVVGGVLRRAGTSALSGASVAAIQPTATGESRAANVAAGAATGAGVSTVLSGAGKLINALRGKVPDSELQKLADKHGIKITLGEVTDNPIIKKSETWLETVPLVGLKRFRENQQKQTEAAAQTFLSKYIIDPAAPDTMKANREFASSLFQKLDTEISGIGQQEIKPTETRAIAKRLLERYPDIFKKFQDTKREGLVASIVSDTGNVTKTDPLDVLSNLYGLPKGSTSKEKTLTFNELWELRAGIGEMIGQSRKQLVSGMVDETTHSTFKRLYAAVNNDIEKWASSIGRPDIKTAITGANDAYKQYVVKYDIIQRAYDKAEGTVGAGEMFSPKKFSTALKNIAYKDKQLKKFTPQEIDEMTGLANIMQVAKRAGQFMENPPTGNRYGPLTLLGGLEGAAYLAGGAATSIKTAGAALGVSAIGTILTSTKAGKALSLAASRIEPDSPQMQRIINQIYLQAPKFAASAVVSRSGENP